MKSPIAVQFRELLHAHIDESNDVEMMRLACAVAANQNISALSQVAAASRPTMAAAAPATRFVNLDAQGNVDVNGPWVFDRTTRLVWARSVLDGEFTYADALKACEKVKFMGHACRASTLPERFSINDYTKHSPALDTAHFAKESGWEWTSTVDAESPSVYAWDVSLGYGGCTRYYQSLRLRVRPVLAGQNLSFNF